MIKKAILISDIHFGMKNSNQENLDEQKNYFYNWFFKLLKKENPDYLFMLGDLFDNRSTLNIQVMNVAIDIFKTIATDMNIPIIMIAGNHDIFMKSTNDINSIKIFSHIPNIQVYENPVQLNFFDKKCLFVPWINDKKEESAFYLKNKSEYLFCHTEFQDTFFNSYVKIVDGVNFDDIKNYQKVFSGHIHHRQETGNLTLIGCPYHITRNDINNKKGIYVIDFEKNETKFIKNNFSPEYVKIDLKEIFEMTLEEYEKIITNNFVDITFNQDILQYFTFNKLLDVSEKFKKINFNAINQAYETIEFEHNLTDDFNEIDLFKLLTTYVENTDYNIELKNVLFDYLKNLYHRAITGV